MLEQNCKGDQIQMDIPNNDLFPGSPSPTLHGTLFNTKIHPRLWIQIRVGWKAPVHQCLSLREFLLFLSREKLACFHDLLE
jgi:hypothetical protein